MPKANQTSCPEPPLLIPGVAVLTSSVFSYFVDFFSHSHKVVKSFMFFLVLFKVYCIDHSYITIRVVVAASVRDIISAVTDKLGSVEDPILVKMSSAGGIVFNMHRIR